MFDIHKGKTPLVTFIHFKVTETFIIKFFRRIWASLYPFDIRALSFGNIIFGRVLTMSLHISTMAATHHLSCIPISFGVGRCSEIIGTETTSRKCIRVDHQLVRF